MDKREQTDDADINHINNVVYSGETDETIEPVVVDQSETKPDADQPMNTSKMNSPKKEKTIPQKIPVKSKAAAPKVVGKKPMKPKTTASPKTIIPLKSTKAHTRQAPVKKIMTKKGEKRIEKSKLTWLWIAIAFVVIAAVALLVFFLTRSGPINSNTSEIAATVNGEAIYTADIDEQYNNLNPLLQQIYTKETILNQTIDEVLLVQDAKNNNIRISKADIDLELTNFKVQNGLTDEQLDQLLTAQNLTQAELEKLIERRLLIKEILNQTIFKNINITEKQIQDFYENNKANLTTPEQVEVQHILILVQDNFTDDQARSKIEMIKNKLTPSNFCDLVKNYSEDPGSRNTCGTYTFAKGEMVPEFEEASFRLDVNETEIVKTSYGYHLIKKLGSIPSSVPKIEDVREQIESKLRDEAAQVNFEALIRDLRNNATIVNYMYKTNTTSTIEETASDEENTKAPAITIIEQGSQSTMSVPSDKNTTYDDLARCLNDKGARLYCKSSICTSQVSAFGESIELINYIECEIPGNDQQQAQACTDAAINGYPTWVINGTKFAGEQTIENLQRISGC